MKVEDLRKKYQKEVVDKICDIFRNYYGLSVVSGKKLKEEMDNLGQQKPDTFVLKDYYLHGFSFEEISDDDSYVLLYDLGYSQYDVYSLGNLGYPREIREVSKRGDLNYSDSREFEELVDRYQDLKVS